MLTIVELLVFSTLFDLNLAHESNGHEVGSKEHQYTSPHPTFTCPLWFEKEPLKVDGLCFPLNQITCNETHFFVMFGICATYSEEDDLLSTFHCPFFRAKHSYNTTTDGYLLLPGNISQLNDNMCGPLKRKGTVCSECMDGYAPAVNSFKDECCNCKGVWYGVPLYLVVELLPVTIFYLIILIFQVNITSAPMTCFIMYSQVILSIFSIKFEDPSVKKLLYTERHYPSEFMKIFFTSYGIWNLDFFQYIIPPFCVSSRLQSIHIAFLDYISAFYPLCLIIFTWICIELHDRNFRLLVVMWKPFHLCLVPLRRALNIKGDIISVFASFFLLTYSKLLYQLIVLTMCKSLKQTKYHSSTYDRVNSLYISIADPRVFSVSAKYWTFAIPAVVISLLFNIIPVLMIVFYPVKRCRGLLSKCRLDSNALKFFVERFQGCYKDISHEGRDMRSFSALYFILRIIILLGVLLLKPLTGRKQLLWFPTGTLVLISAILIASCKPYKKMYMTVADTLLLTHFGLLCYLMSVACLFNEKYIWPFVKVLFLIPYAVFILWLLRMMVSFVRQSCSKRVEHLQRNVQNLEHNDSFDSELSQPLIVPTTSTIDITSYGSL